MKDRLIDFRFMFTHAQMHTTSCTMFSATPMLTSAIPLAGDDTFPGRGLAKSGCSTRN